jgi:hypothetical protein
MNLLQSALAREAARMGLSCEHPFQLQLPSGMRVEAQKRITNQSGEAMHVFADGDIDDQTLDLLSRSSVGITVLSMPRSERDYEDCREMFADWGLVDP